jgi:hypothetical protein
VRFANPIYQEIIPRVLSAAFAESLPSDLVDSLWYIKEGRLDMNALLLAFQKFYRRHSEAWLEKYDFREAGRQLLLMAFLHRIVNGRIEREMAVGNGRCDLLIEYGDEQCNRWLVFRVTRKTLRFYVTQKLSLRELIANPVDGFLYSIELDDELQCQQCCLIQPQNLPPKYLPAVDSYYDFSKLDPEDTEAKGLILEKIWDEKHELSDLLTKLFDKPPLEMIDEPSLA